MKKRLLAAGICIMFMLMGCSGNTVTERSNSESQNVISENISADAVSVNETGGQAEEDVSRNQMTNTESLQIEEVGNDITGEELENLDIPEDMLAYWLVLNGKKPFVSYDIGGQEFYWNEFYGIRADEFMIVDMDNDGKKEVVIYAWPESAWVLHYEDGSVYGYEFAFRGMLDIHTDGIYQQSGGSGNGSYCRFTELNADGYAVETLVEYDYYGHAYEIGGKEASEEEALELIESVRDGSEKADKIDGADTIQLLGSLTSEEYSVLENVQREEIIYPAVSYPMEADARKAYYDVLTNQREFISTMDDNERFYLKDYFPREEYQFDESDISSLTWRPDRIWYFGIVDMDGDGTYEVILDGTYDRDILSYRNGEVYSYRMNAGIIFDSGIVCTSGYYSPEYKRITSFNDYEYIMEAVDYDGDINEERIQYYYFSEELIEQYLGV